ncbi:phage tail tube protein [Microbacterium enclense]|uniref:phage tail tube protein n=1 Tax=Microbacterium enclense TaxID=993073 RepID=UPI0021A2FDC5|nr:phage tail tube protein [Microbacterium enclense]MCT2086777.1 phage tail tube protein [Microbacterium enclense]
MTQLDFSLGIGAEATYGAPVTVTRFPESDAQLSYEITTVDGKGMRPTKAVKRLLRNSVSKYEGKGSISLDVTTRGFGFLLAAVLGNVQNTMIASSTPPLYQQNHTLRNTDPVPSYTIQELLPTLGGNNTFPHTFTGCVFESLELSAKEGGILEAVLEVVTRAMQTDQAAAAPSYPTSDGLFTFVHGAVRIGSATAPTLPGATALGTWVGVADAVNVRDVTVRVKRNLDGNGWNLGGAGLRSRRPVLGRAEISGSITAEYTDNVLRDAYLQQTPLALQLTFLHDAAVSSGGSATTAALQITIPSLRLKGEVPKSNGGETITQSIEWEAFDNDVAAQPIVISYRTLDTTP